MIANTPTEFLYLFLTALVAGVGWTLGCWVTNKLLSKAG